MSQFSSRSGWFLPTLKYLDVPYVAARYFGNLDVFNRIEFIRLTQRLRVDLGKFVELLTGFAFVFELLEKRPGCRFQRLVNSPIHYDLIVQRPKHMCNSLLVCHRRNWNDHV